MASITTPTSQASPSTVGSAASPTHTDASFSPYRRRFDGNTRRQALERRKGKSPRSNKSTSGESSQTNNSAPVLTGGIDTSVHAKKSALEAILSQPHLGLDQGEEDPLDHVTLLQSVPVVQRRTEIQTEHTLSTDETHQDVSLLHGERRGKNKGLIRKVPPCIPQLETGTLTTDVSTGSSLVQQRMKAFDGSSQKSNSVGRKAQPDSSSSHKQSSSTISSGSGESTIATTASSTTQLAQIGGGIRRLSLDECSDHSQKTEKARIDIGDAHQDSSFQCVRNQPQHQMQGGNSAEAITSSPAVRYYRVIYKGVVSLLSQPNTTSSRSGAYVSYGEIIASHHEYELDNEDESVSSVSLRQSRSVSGIHNSIASPPRSVASQTAGSMSSLDTFRTASTTQNYIAQPQQQQHGERQKDSPQFTSFRKLIRVDDVLTGGYAVDGSETEATTQSAMQTPKRSNTHYLPIVEPSPLPVIGTDPFDGNSCVPSGNAAQSSSGTPTITHGFLLTKRKNVTIAEEIGTKPICQTGQFLYKITSSTPLPILTGPCLDAPKTRAMALPGTVHEVCLTVFVPNDGGDEITFLRLFHRRGWIADKRMFPPGTRHKLRSVPVVKDVTNHPGESPSDQTRISLSSMSLASSSITTPGSTARRRHRPPRRKKENSSQKTDITLVPRNPGGLSMNTTPINFRPESIDTPNRAVSHVAQNALSPSSNISLLSEGSSLLDTSRYKDPIVGADLIDSVSRRLEAASNIVPSVLLMRVNAPKGLKILDAPHFQVNTLIRGQRGASRIAISPHIRSTTSNIPKPSTSVFSQTTPTTRGNPSVLDGKTRILPRGALFEASKRMDTSGGYSQGAGLIKLADNSGWAIVPHQGDLDKQYKNFHGGVRSTRAGEATKACEEVGNAILSESDEQQPQNDEGTTSTVWLRVATKNGVLVSCTPPIASTTNDVDTSPISSTGGHSSTILTRENSDVASSVGSAFLDAMFHTPKKRETERGSDIDKETSLKLVKSKEREKPSHVIQCGICVEADRWAGASEHVRLSGGQGWIMRHINGRECAVTARKPSSRYGSFWFQVQSQRGVKVRLGPSRKATSIKSDDGVFFRFECGEFLRACEVVTYFDGNGAYESFAKLYRNRHAELLQYETQEHRLLVSLTSSAEWVQIHSRDHSLFLEECNTAPRIQRQQQGWRYNALCDSGVEARKGPSFRAEKTGLVLLGGKSVLVNERVTGAGERITWLRLKDSQGWVHDTGPTGEVTMIAHSLEHRPGGTTRRLNKSHRNERDDAAYNTIIARLFHGETGDSNQGVHRVPHCNN